MGMSFKTYTQTEMASTIRATARPLSGYTVERPALILMPIRDRKVDQAVPGVAFVTLMRKRTEPEHAHSTILAAFTDGGDMRFTFFCGDKGLSGSINGSTYREHCQHAAELAAPSHQLTLRERMVAAHGLHPENNPCGFWSRGGRCKHTDGFFDQLLQHPASRRMGLDGFLAALSAEAAAMMPLVQR